MRFLRCAHSAEDVRIDHLIMFKNWYDLGNSGPGIYRTCQVHPTYDWKISGPFVSSIGSIVVKPTVFWVNIPNVMKESK